ncbi:Hypothetical predicted protein [Podarcis lilfordi]|uniref:C-type lectin domain-containing protein n=1 Tax=Podarcis lilfordi TaxID=74358 RepID=A0AA35KZQ4_9SAUR|nr:Hypothetical predicted protein [Podarcis lilfordi]
MQPSSDPRLSLLCTCLVLIWQLSFGFAMKIKKAENPYGLNGCLRGWKREMESCYHVFSNRLTWHEAVKTCRVFDMTSELVSIREATELDLLAEDLKRSMELSVWIGLSDEDRDGNWKWTDGSAAEFLPWAEGEPNKHGINSCASLFRGDGFEKFRAESCKNVESYVCKHRPNYGSS